MITEILGAMVIALVSGIIGNVIGTRNIVGRTLCDERRATCNRLLSEQLDNICDKIEALTKVVNDKIGIVI